MCKESKGRFLCCGDNPMQQHRLREISQEAASQKSWGVWWVETLEQVQRRVTKLAKGPVNVVCGQRARELGLPRGLRAGLIAACNYLMRGEKKSNQALCRSSHRKKEAANTISES